MSETHYATCLHCGATLVTQRYTDQHECEVAITQAFEAGLRRGVVEERARIVADIRRRMLERSMPADIRPREMESLLEWLEGRATT